MCLTVYNRRAGLLQTSAQVQIAALIDSVPIHLVEQRSEAHPQPLGGFATVAPRGPKDGGDGLALSGLHGIAQGTAPGSPLLPRGAGSGERLLPKVSRLQKLLVRKHRRPFDGVLERAYVTRPRLLAQPLERRIAQGHAPAQPTGEPRREMASQGRDVLPPPGEGGQGNRYHVQPVGDGGPEAAPPPP